eukprot:1896544-Rhodomonas_salina.1
MEAILTESATSGACIKASPITMSERSTDQTGRYGRPDTMAAPNSLEVWSVRVSEKECQYSK